MLTVIKTVCMSLCLLKRVMDVMLQPQKKENTQKYTMTECSVTSAGVIFTLVDFKTDLSRVIYLEISYVFHCNIERIH